MQVYAWPAVKPPVTPKHDSSEGSRKNSVAYFVTCDMHITCTSLVTYFEIGWRPDPAGRLPPPVLLVANRAASGWPCGGRLGTTTPSFFQVIATRLWRPAKYNCITQKIIILNLKPNNGKMQSCH